MRISTGPILTGLIALGALALGASGALASNNGPDAYIGIVGGSPQPYTYSANGDINRPYGEGEGANHGFANRWGHYDGEYHSQY